MELSRDTSFGFCNTISGYKNYAIRKTKQKSPQLKQQQSFLAVYQRGNASRVTEIMFSIHHMF